MRKLLAIVILLTVLRLEAQTEIFKPSVAGNKLTAPVLYIGASFIYMGGGSTVTLKENGGWWNGDLSVINQTTGVGPVFLFHNHDAPGSTLNLAAKIAMNPADQIVFKYQVVSKPPGGQPFRPNDLLAKYSGPNKATDPYVSASSSDANSSVAWRPIAWRFGRRWSVVGRVAPTVLEFGFEDMSDQGGLSPNPATGGVCPCYTYLPAGNLAVDMDFDDIVFQVSNMDIGVFSRSLLTKNFVR